MMMMMPLYMHRRTHNSIDRGTEFYSHSCKTGFFLSLLYMRLHAIIWQCEAATANKKGADHIKSSSNKINATHIFSVFYFCVYSGFMFSLSSPRARTFFCCADALCMRSVCHAYLMAAEHICIKHKMYSMVAMMVAAT